MTIMMTTDSTTATTMAVARATNASTILKTYGLYDDVLSIIGDYLIGTKEKFKDTYSDTIQEMEAFEFSLYRIHGYPHTDIDYSQMVESLIIRSLRNYERECLNFCEFHDDPEDEYSRNSVYDNLNSYSSRSLKEWCENTITISIKFDILQRKLEKFLRIFPNILDKPKFTDTESKRISRLFGVKLDDIYNTYQVKYFLTRLRNRDMEYRMYLNSFGGYEHKIFDTITNFPDITRQRFMYECLKELRETFKQREKKQRTEIIKKRMKENTKFFSGWTHTYSIKKDYIDYGYKFLLNNTVFTITRKTDKCIYYTKTDLDRGIEYQEKRKKIKIEDRPGIYHGVEYFTETNDPLDLRIYASDIVYDHA